MGSFGDKANQTTSLSELLDMEQAESRQDRFAQLDALMGYLVVQVLRGHRIVKPIQNKESDNTLDISELTNEQRIFVDDTFHLERQRARGAWFVPESASLRLGMITLPACFREYGRFGSGIAREENNKFSLKQSPDFVLLWATLEPLFTTLFLPFEIRGYQAGTKSREDQLKSWEEVDRLLEVLELSVSGELAVMRYGGGWHKLRAYAQFEAKQRLLDALATQADPVMAAKYRAYRIRGLVQQYYKKAKSGGRVKRKQVLTKQYERVLAGYFGGDWLAFLDYIGEQPHPEEEVFTALPKTRLHVGGSERAEEIAAQHNVSAEEVKRIAAAYWQQPVSKSPVEQRVELLHEYWKVFDQIHTRQVPGMKSLWGLVEENRFLTFGDHIDHFHPLLYQELLPQSITSEIERLWGTFMLTKWPDRIVSVPFPHALLAETLGPALKLWQGCALTAWFLCEGPYSRTDMAGLREYYQREIGLLQSLGTPIAPDLFDNLIKAEASLGPAEPIEEDSSTIEVGYGISVSVSTSFGNRRPGFEKLRDIITSYRRAWTEQYFARYLKSLWESEIGEAERAYNLLLNQKGKPPTVKQFAGAAASAINHWFGGNINGLYGALRERSPVEPRYEPIMPSDRIGFARLVFENLGGRLFDRQRLTEPQEGQDRRFERLAELSYWYVQLEEALGRAPTLKEFGPNKIQYHGTVLSENLDDAWAIFSRAVEIAKRSATQVK